MKPIAWELYRDYVEGTLDLAEAFEDVARDELKGTDAEMTEEGHRRGLAYLDLVTSLQPVTSREVAATVLATALAVGRLFREPRP